MNKLISIIINVKYEEYFQDCFSSLLVQTIGFENLELILINFNDEQFLQYENVLFASFDNYMDYCHSDYVMFLDSNIIFEEDALECLYHQIISGDYDVVSGNNSHLINMISISQQMDLLKASPKIYAKIFKKNLIIKNNIDISRVSFNNDLLFISNCLINAKGIKYFDKCIGKKIDKNSLNKLELMDFSTCLINFHNIIKKFDDIYLYLMFEILEEVWIKEFCLSKISNVDKMDILMASKELFRKYKDNNILNDELKLFINLINSKKYTYATKLSNLLALKYSEKREYVKNIIKEDGLNFVFFDLDTQPGGTGIAVMNKVNKLVEKGYKINLLSVDRVKNYKYIKNYLQKTGRLSKKVNVVNIFEYYSDKNTLSDEIKKASVDKEYHVKKIKNNDNSITYEYFDKSNNNKKVKIELFVDGAIIFRDDLINSKRDYFTLDGFNYLTRIEKNKKGKYFLHDRVNCSTIEFTIFNQLLCHFINEYTNTIDEKPIIICENTTNNFNINRIDPRKAIKLGSMHGNPYLIDENSKRYINPNVSHFKIINDLKAMVLLTDSVKNDLSNEFDYDRFVVIPNFIEDEKLEYDPVEKELKIGIFSRISPEKNLSDALRSFKIVSERFDKVILEIWGRIDFNNREEINKLKDLSEKLNISDKVIFKGFSTDVSYEMKKSFCSMLVSDHEGLPLSLLESMANSTPVVSYDINYGPKDVITNGSDGFIVEHGDYESIASHIIKLLEDPDLAIRMGVNAREKIKNKFSASVVSQQWEKLFVDVYVQSRIDDFEQMLKERNYNNLVKNQRNLNSEINRLRRENKILERKLNDSESFCDDILNSTSWKVTKPLRNFKNNLKRD